MDWGTAGAALATSFGFFCSTVYYLVCMIGAERKGNQLVTLSIKQFAPHKKLAERFQDGALLIFRLTPQHYHRYGYAMGGKVLRARKIRGKLHCVRPIALRTVPVFAQNSREYEVIAAGKFGIVVQMEIGALLVGKINNFREKTDKSRVWAGDEKGYFAFGGSTIVVMLQKGNVVLNEALYGRQNGRAYKQIYYNSIYVRADRMESVEPIQKAIRDMGFEANSNTEWLKQTQEQMRTIQMALGGIGAVSLFVAAIGIANTMMMSIYERTKEIGILKVLGCDLTDIHRTFLMEAGFIGLVGGCIGLLLSYGVSAIINIAAKSSAYQGISYIPFWLASLAIVFSVVMGMVAGGFPEFRAMHLSPLAALRNE